MAEAFAPPQLSTPCTAVHSRAQLQINSGVLISLERNLLSKQPVRLFAVAPPSTSDGVGLRREPQMSHDCIFSSIATSFQQFFRKIQTLPVKNVELRLHFY